MKIKCLTTFLDGVERYEKDDVRTVPDERGAYFIDHGWAENTDPNAAPIAATNSLENVELAIQPIAQKGLQEGLEVKNG